MQSLQMWLNTPLFNNTIQEYALAIATMVGLVLVFLLAKKFMIGRLRRLARRTAVDFDDFIVEILAQVGAPTFIAVSLYLSTLPLKFDEPVRMAVRYLMIMVVTVRVILIFQQIIRYAVAKSYRRARPNDPSADTMINNLSNVLGVAVWALGLVFVLDNLGIDISALVAGLGIGGIAVAMASQALLGDFFSAISIFTDKPFEVGDFIIIDEFMGTVEYIGIKTTRIRSLHGEQLIFSNSDLTKSRIKNYKRMQTRRVEFKIGVVYQTEADKVKKIPVIIRQIVESIPGTRLDRVHFHSFGDFSLVYEVVYFVLSADYNVYMDKQQAINFSIMEVFEQEKIEFAYPTQTLHLSKITQPASKNPGAQT